VTLQQVRIPEPGAVIIEQVPEPIPQPGETLLRVLHVGICGSDVHTFTGHNPLGAYPLVPGHELSARVEAVNDPGSDLRPGDLVVLEPLVRCGQCYPCRRGRYNCCERLQVMGVRIDGGMRDKLAAATALLHRVPAGVSPRTAALTEPSTIGLQALARARVTREDTVAVIGAGPIGTLACLAAQSMGAKVAIWDIKPERLQRARALGIEAAIAADGADAVERTVEALNGRPSVVVEAVGLAQTIASAVDLVRPAGRVVVIGVSTQDIQFTEALLIRKELDLLGSRNSADMFPRALQFVQSHQAALDQLITHELPLAEAEAGIRLMMDKTEDVMKVLLRVG